MTDTQRGPGRPAIGGAVYVRLGPLRERVEQWAAEHDVKQAEAVRQLVERGLDAD